MKCEGQSFYKVTVSLFIVSLQVRRSPTTLAPEAHLPWRAVLGSAGEESPT